MKNCEGNLSLTILMTMRKDDLLGLVVAMQNQVNELRSLVKDAGLEKKSCKQNE